VGQFSTPKVGQFSTPIDIQCNIRDITARKRVEENVREQVVFLETLFDTIPNPIFHKDANGRYTGCNRAFLEFTGKPMEEILGKTVYDIVSKDIADNYAKKDRELFEHPGKQHYEWLIQNTLGEVREVIFDKATLLDAQGAVTGLIGVISDITERKQAEDEVRRSNKELALTIQALSEKTENLEEVNAALRVLLRQREEDRKELGESVVANIRNLILPYAEKMKQSPLSSAQMTWMKILESHINEITSSFGRTLATQYANLTSTEIRTATLVRDGRSTAQIAELLGISEKTVCRHRDNIRKKLGLRGGGINLRTHLLGLQ
jgi:PAS domain S-box-containing protein